MRQLRRITRLARLMLHVVVGATLTALFGGRSAEGFVSPRYDRIVTWWLGKVRRILNVKVTVHGEPAAAPVLIAANHISWLDIPLLGGLTRSHFLSKQEVRQWPAVGWLAARAGTIFIERGGRNAAENAVERLIWHLKWGKSPAIFPEGTTTDGQRVRRFHPRLLSAAVYAGTAVQPVAIRYPGQTGPKAAVPFIDNAGFLEHALRLLGEDRIRAEVTFCTPIASKGLDRRTLASRAQAAVAAVVESDPETASGSEEA